MRKVFIGVLAALMLFAFVACDNNAPQAPLMGNQIEGVELVSVPDYLYGEKIDPAKVQLNVVKNDGSKIAYTGTELQMDAVTLNADTTAVAVTYAGLNFYVNVPAYAVELVTFDISGIKASTISLGSSDVFDITGTTVMATYDGGKTKDATSLYFAKNPNKKISAAAILEFFKDANGDLPKAGTSITVSSAVLPTEVVEVKGTNYTLSGSKTLTVTEAAKAIEITAASLTQVNTDKDDALVEVFNVGSQNKISNAAIKVSYTLKKADGTTETKDIVYGGKATSGVTLTDLISNPTDPANDGDVVIILQNYVDDFEFSSAKSSATDILATIKVKVGSDVAEKKDVPLSISAINNYVESAVFTAKKESKWDIDSPIKADQFDITYTWAAPGKTSYSQGENTPTIGTWTPEYSAVKENTPEGNLKIKFTYNGDLGLDAKKTLVEEATVVVDYVE